jgi:hypothetical protein
MKSTFFSDSKRIAALAIPTNKHADRQADQHLFFSSRSEVGPLLRHGINSNYDTIALGGRFLCARDEIMRILPTQHNVGRNRPYAGMNVVILALCYFHLRAHSADAFASTMANAQASPRRALGLASHRPQSLPRLFTFNTASHRKNPKPSPAPSNVRQRAGQKTCANAAKETVSLLEQVFRFDQPTKKTTTTHKRKAVPSRSDKAGRDFWAEKTPLWMTRVGSGYNPSPASFTAIEPLGALPSTPVQMVHVLMDPQRQEQFKRALKKDYPILPDPVLDACLDVISQVFVTVTPKQLQKAMTPSGYQTMKPQIVRDVVRIAMRLPILREDTRPFLTRIDKQRLLTAAMNQAMDLVFVPIHEQYLLLSPTQQLAALEQQMQLVKSQMTVSQKLHYYLVPTTRRSKAVVAGCLVAVFVVTFACQPLLNVSLARIGRTIKSNLSILLLAAKKEIKKRLRTHGWASRNRAGWHVASLNRRRHG